MNSAEWDNLVSKVTGYWLDDRGSFPGRERMCLFAPPPQNTNHTQFKGHFLYPFPFLSCLI
jgi:hypothetical protein